MSLLRFELLQRCLYEHYFDCASKSEDVPLLEQRAVKKLVKVRYCFRLGLFGL